MIVLETQRLLLRRFSLDDAVFIRALLNEPSWLRFIGDKGVRSVEDARNYILKGPMAMYERLGFGLYLTERCLPGDDLRAIAQPVTAAINGEGTVHER